MRYTLLFTVAADSEYPGDIKSKQDIALPPFTVCIGNERTFIHAGGISKMKLEYMSARFNIKADG